MYCIDRCFREGWVKCPESLELLSTDIETRLKVRLMRYIENISSFQNNTSRRQSISIALGVEFCTFEHDCHELLVA